jgi:hypothetical protein
MNPPIELKHLLPAMGLVDIVGDLVEDYEAEHQELPPASGLQALRFLMEQHGLKSEPGPVTSACAHGFAPRLPPLLLLRIAAHA